MTENEWMTSNDPRNMIDFAFVSGDSFRRAMTDRELRLIACAIESIWWNDETGSPMRLFKVAEALADGSLKPGSRQVERHADHDCYWLISSPASLVLYRSLDLHNLAADNGTWADVIREIIGNPWQKRAIEPRCLTPEVKSMAHSIYGDRGKRCSCSNGAVGVAYSYCRNCEGTGRINLTIDQDRMHVLADLLEDNGCDDEVILKHLHGLDFCVACDGLGVVDKAPYSRLKCTDCCDGYFRSLSGHFRGCWVLDQILGFE